jgi:formaldehyde-activating enzyme involved in methanogenesis
VLTLAADIITDVFAAESVLLRASTQQGLHHAAAQVYISDAAGRVELAARNALAAMSDGDTLRTMLAALRRLLKPTPVNAVALRRQIADAIVDRKAYPFQ